MEKYISTEDEEYYTHLLKLINAIGGRSLEYRWLITDIEAYPQNNDGNLNQKLYKLFTNNEYLILSNDELMDILEEDDFQWIWGVFSAIPEKYSNEEILKYELPYAENNSEIFMENNCMIQHPLAEIEIVAEDATSVFIVSKDDKVAELFKKAYPKATGNY